MSSNEIEPVRTAAHGGMQRGRRVAWLVAIVTDAVQWIALPLFAPGGLSPVEAGLDVIVALLMVRLLGWHWAFLPSFAAELIPGLNLVPTWTFAVWLATRGRGKAGEAAPVANDPPR